MFFPKPTRFEWCHDIQRNDTQHNDIKKTNSQLNGTPYWEMLWWAPLLLSAANKSIVLSIAMLYVIMSTSVPFEYDKQWT